MGDWKRYFDEVAQFLEGAERHYGVANESFTENVLGRLELCMRTCSVLRDHLADEAGLDEAEVATVREYHRSMDDLLECTLSCRLTPQVDSLEAGNALMY